MANTTIYPFGTDGTLPSSIGLANDLITNDSSQALAASQGVVINGGLAQVGQTLGDNVTINPKGVPGGEEVNLVINSNNKWSTTSGPYVGYIIPIVADAIYKFSNQSSGQGVIAFLQTSAHTNGSTPAFSAQYGYSARITIAQNATIKIVAPFDAQYLYVLASVSAENRLVGIESVGYGMEQSISGEEELSQTGFRTVTGMISSSQQWDISRNSFTLLPVREDMVGKRIELTANSSGNSVCAFLSAPRLASGGTNPSFSAGVRIVVKKKTTFASYIPEGTKYLYLYAASGQEFSKIIIFDALEEKGTVGAEAGIYSWWTYPLAITTNEVRKKLIYSWVNAAGGIGISVRGLFGGKTSKAVISEAEVDDHNAPALVELADGRLAAIYTKGHNETSNIYVKITSDPYKYDVFSTATTVAMGGLTSYVQVFLIGSTYYIFTRISTTNWAYVTTTDFTTFSSPHTLISSASQYYVKFTTVSDEPNVLRMTMYSNPNYGDNGIRLGYVDVSSGNVYNNTIAEENIVGTLTGTAISNTAFTEIIPVPSGRQRLFDVAISPLDDVRIAYATFATSSTTNSKYKMYDNGTVQNLCDGGPAFYNTSHYQGGISFYNKDRIVLSRGDSESDIIEVWSKVDDTWGYDYTVFGEKRGTAPIRNIRPMFDNSAMFLLWQRGRYNPSSYTDWDMDIVSTLFLKP